MAGRLLTALNYSGGVQSEWMLWMVLLGIIPKPKYFAVFTADPGMENHRSYLFVEAMRERCREAGIDFITASGPNLYEDMIGLKASTKTRIDNPPFWTPSQKKKDVGQLTQKCTQHYKIAPMDRAVRVWINNHWGVGVKNSSWLGVNAVEKWIGFTLDEQHRADGMMAYKRQKYVNIRFPLIEAGLTKSDVISEFLKRDLAIPDRSICNGCPYYGLRQLKIMHDERQDDWRQAVAIDEAARDLSQIGVKHPCYVSKTLIPLTQLAEMNFELPDAVENDLQQCDSGACFI